MKPDIPLESLILTLRQQKVILDADLAGLYGVPNKRLNEQVKRNADRFPEDFMFQLTAQEWGSLKSQIATSSPDASADKPDEKTGLRSQIATLSAAVLGNKQDARNRSQIATGSQKHRDPRFLPYAFTEHGALMAANVLNSPRRENECLCRARLHQATRNPARPGRRTQAPRPDGCKTSETR